MCQGLRSLSMEWYQNMPVELLPNKLKDSKMSKFKCGLINERIDTSPPGCASISDRRTKIRRKDIYRALRISPSDK